MLYSLSFDDFAFNHTTAYAHLDRLVYLIGQNENIIATILDNTGATGCNFEEPIFHIKIIQKMEKKLSNPDFVGSVLMRFFYSYVFCALFVYLYRPEYSTNSILLFSICNAFSCVRNNA